MHNHSHVSLFERILTYRPNLMVALGISAMFMAAIFMTGIFKLYATARNIQYAASSSSAAETSFECSFNNTLPPLNTAEPEVYTVDLKFSYASHINCAGTWRLKNPYATYPDPVSQFDLSPDGKLTVKQGYAPSMGAYEIPVIFTDSSGRSFELTYKFR
ncbi:MAG TPA: hypothetical protein VEA59_07155 [Patescibacteria group bacterium]|nr:hypothetical protein [Patescibacteria group bacterium]